MALADALARCDAAADCADYERLQLRYFDVLGAYDPLMMLTWSRHLYTSADGRLSRYRDAYTWAGRASERSSEWSGSTRTRHMREILEIRARAAARMLEANPSDASRQVARDAALAWAELLRSLSLDATPALDLCASATGEAARCGKRLTTEALLEPITMLSLPPRAELEVDGEARGLTPVTVDLPHGSHTVVMRLGGVETTHTILVGAGAPTRWQWRKAEQEWKSWQ
ncbi:MAG: PEGA domain-containing protein [Alphaproteobacteria bacterium]|nr:PEGA domain-containing protein [Alphaproteobacteria bacterium]